jgi:hypothetical protein
VIKGGNSVSTLLDWLISSGIHHIDSENNRDAFYEAYDGRRKQYSFLYCEITGYAVALLLSIYRREGRGEYIEMAKRAGDFLISVQHTKGDANGAMPWSVDKDGCRHFLCYSFDTSICLNALVELYRMSGEIRLLKAAVAAADWLVEGAQRANGSFRAVYDIRQGSFDEHRLNGSWSASGGCLHIKHLISLIKIYRLTGLEKYLESARRLLGWSLSMQREDGAYRAVEESGYVFTHGHSYATEGIIYAFSYLREPKLKEILVKSADWLVVAQNADGSYYDYYDLPNRLRVLLTRRMGIAALYGGVRNVLSNGLVRIKRSDATCQAARIMLFAYLLTGDERYRGAARRALQCVERLETAVGDGERGSAICFGVMDFFGVERKSQVYPSWGNMFAISALRLLSQVESCNSYDLSEYACELF